MFAKLFIVALAVVCASGYSVQSAVYPLAYSAGVVPAYAYNAPATAYSTYSGSPVTYSTFSSNPTAYSAYSAYSAPVVRTPSYYYGRTVVV
uniref:Uncharacterized protein n=1 Tax=Anopheles stephensi TaxID=30069 RepID=A0A182Y2Q4_ANOST